MYLREGSRGRGPYTLFNMGTYAPWSGRAVEVYYQGALSNVNGLTNEDTISPGMRLSPNRSVPHAAHVYVDKLRCTITRKLEDPFGKSGQIRSVAEPTFGEGDLR